jgi:hypothetical protein
VWLNGVKILNDAAVHASAYTNILQISEYPGTVGEDNYIDDLLVRNWTAPEPTWTSWGDESAESKTVISNAIISNAIIQ